MKKKEIKDLSVTDLQAQLKAEQAELNKMKIAHAVSPVDNPMKIRHANGGLAMQELTGIKGVRIGNDRNSTGTFTLAIQRVPSAMNGRKVNPEYVTHSSKREKLGAGSSPEEYVPAYVWFNAAFVVPDTARWFCPWNITIAADRDALLYVNGRFVGYYRTIGPQSAFYLPEPYLSHGREQKNILTVMLAYTDNLSPLKQLTISPYTEFAARRIDIAMEWPRP